MRNLPPQMVQQLISSDSNVVLLDVREKWEFETCNIESSINIPMGAFPAAAKDFDDQAQTIVICHHGARSMQVANYLENAGFINVINLDGGIDAWAMTIDLDMEQY